jgi:hypothetical protein
MSASNNADRTGRTYPASWPAAFKRVKPRDRCNEPVPAWKFTQPMRCNLEKGHAGECNHV